MEPDSSVMMVWPMAAMEAQASGWSEIEPAHLLCATLKFAEFDADDLEQLGEATGGLDELRQHNRELRERLDEPWGIVVPDISRPLRRALRQRGDVEPRPHMAGMIHRSNGTREVFRSAQAIAERDGRRQFCLADLADVILRNPDEWVRRGLGRHQIPSESQLVRRDQDIEKWDGLFVPLASAGPLNSAEKKRILADPAVCVLTEALAKPGPRPNLLIHSPDRTARDVLTDLLNHPRDGKPPRITEIDSRSLLHRLAEDPGFSVTAFLDFLTDGPNHKTVWFLDSLHRYLSDDMAPPHFQVHFTQWIKQTNNRFLFAISERQYDKQVEQHPDWASTFKLIWIHAPPRSTLMEL